MTLRATNRNIIPSEVKRSDTKCHPEQSEGSAIRRFFSTTGAAHRAAVQSLWDGLRPQNDNHRSRMITKVKGWLGHILDLVDAVRFDFKNPHSYTKFRMIQSLKQKSKSKILIEAGTYFGVTADRCSRIFDKVYTIELNQTLAQKAIYFLEPRKNVTVIKGDALKVLPKLLELNGTQNVFVYLDGHVCGPMTSYGDFPGPAVEELKTLSSYREKINAIVIDDFRNFGVEKNFPAKSTLVKVAEDNFPNDRFDISIHWDQLVILRKS